LIHVTERHPQICVGIQWSNSLVFEVAPALEVRSWRSLTKIVHNTKLLGTVLSAAPAMGALAPLTHAADKMSMEKTVTVAGAPMYPSKNKIENAVNSKDHTTLDAEQTWWQGSAQDR
jgi:hypothetical protein